MLKLICLTTLCLSNSTGSKYTLKTRPQELGVDVREELLKYHAKYYSSNLMTLAIVGKGLYWSTVLILMI